MVASISWSPTLDKCLVQDTAPAKPALEIKPVTPNADALPCNTSGRLRLPHELRLSLDTPGLISVGRLRAKRYAPTAQMSQVASIHTIVALKIPALLLLVHG